MAERKEPQAQKEQIVDPWHVSAAEGADKIDYDKIISKNSSPLCSCNVFV